MPELLNSGRDWTIGKGGSLIDIDISQNLTVGNNVEISGNLLFNDLEIDDLIFNTVVVRDKLEFKNANASNSYSIANVNLNNYDDASLNNVEISGNLSIGLSDPNGKLHIKDSGLGTVATANDGTIILEHENNGGSTSILFKSKENEGSDYGAIQYTDGNGSNEKGILRLIAENDGAGGNEDEIRFKVDGSDRVTIASDNVGIGYTSPLYKLDINGTCRASYFYATDGFRTAWWNTPFRIETNSNGIFSTKMTIDSGGDVGIGTTNPDHKLHVKGDIVSENGATHSTTSRNRGFHAWLDRAFGLELHHDGTSWCTALFGRSSDTTCIRFGSYPSNATAQNTFEEKMRILNNGNVGIGITSPTEKLHIDGNLLITGDASVGNTFIGEVGFGNASGTFAGFSHVSCNTTTDYALNQHFSGTTYLNAKSGSTIHFTIGHLDKMRINDASGIVILNNLTICGEIINDNLTNQLNTIDASFVALGSGNGGGSGIQNHQDASLNNVDISGILKGNVSNNQISLGSHIIPTTNAAYDLGNAEYKIRHLFLSDNSLWIGDDHKIDISGGKMKFKKRNKNQIPKGILDICNNITGISNELFATGNEIFDGITNLEQMTPHYWIKYSEHIQQGSPLNIEDIFTNNPENWEEDIENADLKGNSDASFNNVDISGQLILPTSETTNFRIYTYTDSSGVPELRFSDFSNNTEIIYMVLRNEKIYMKVTHSELGTGLSQNLFEVWKLKSSGWWNNVEYGYLETKSTALYNPIETSDDRLKHNEKNINNSIDIIMKLNPQRYDMTLGFKDIDYIGDFSDNEPYRDMAGFIAQEVRDISDLSFCVYGQEYDVSNNPTPLSIDYNSIFTYGIKAIQEQQIIINNLKQENETMKNALNELLTASGKPTI